MAIRLPIVGRPTGAAVVAATNGQRNIESLHMFALVAADTTCERAQGTHAHAQCRRDDGASRPVLSARPAPPRCS